MCWSVSECVFFRKSRWFHSRIRTVPPPSSVTVPPPSTTVSLSVCSASVFVTVMVAGAAPHANVTTPPAVSAVASAASVHDAAVPLPTTVVGVATAAAVMGAAHVGAGGVIPAASTSGGRPLSPPPSPPPPPPAPSPAVPPSSVAPGVAAGEASLDEHAAIAMAPRIASKDDRRPENRHVIQRA